MCRIRGNYLIAAGFASILTAILACRGSDTPETFDVTGIVTYRAQPVANAQVTFHPPQGSGNRGRGVTDRQGRFTLSTYATGDGAVRGKHKVTVEVLQGRNSPAPERLQRLASPIPIRYADAQTTPLEVEIVQAGNDIQLQLED